MQTELQPSGPLTASAAEHSAAREPMDAQERWARTNLFQTWSD